MLHQRFPPSQNHRQLTAPGEYENEAGHSPPPELLPSIPPRFRRTPSEPRSSLPSNSISLKSSDTEPAPCSASTCITSVTSVPPPVARCDPPPDELQKNIQIKQKAHHVQYTLARVRSRRHILEREVCLVARFHIATAIYLMISRVACVLAQGKGEGDNKAG